MSTEPESANFEKMREEAHRQMLSSVSHDLKTPLATMIGSLEIYVRLGDKLTPEKKATLIGSALGEAYRLNNFITNILDMAKLEHSLVQIRNERCDLTSLIEDCVTRLGPKSQNSNITLKALTTETHAYTDATLFGRAVGLLLDNALKHGKHPEKPAAIIVEYAVEDAQILVCVIDNGPGIEAGREEEVFSKYTRLSRNDQQNAGTGLGLAICRQIMQLLTGTVEAKNQETGGAIFTLKCKSFS